MDELSMYDIKFWIKFAILFVPLELWIFFSAPSIKWVLLLSFGAIVGIFLALSGKSLRRR
ncbi:hypothetical protein LCGC14_0476610 [marine sediment metagenome]|uniref:Uncharacterized protein n=1 Tax=marine sediment metagenome TaxID=412755 RepID=A0A0F9VJF4_9ZZZZ|nr:hypothetical protein [bacterium]